MRLECARRRARSHGCFRGRRSSDVGRGTLGGAMPKPRHLGLLLAVLLAVAGILAAPPRPARGQAPSHEA
jgi:hypothetical protein